MSKIDLPNITLVSVTSIRLEETILAIKKSCRGINFGAVKLFTDVDVEAEGIEVVKVPKMDIVEYNRFVIYELYKYIDTDFALQIQSDGYVVNPEMWRDDFLDYDYIGAPWGFNCFYDRYGEPIKVGNGISIRSKKLMEIPPNAPKDSVVMTFLYTEKKTGKEMEITMDALSKMDSIGRQKLEDNYTFKDRKDKLIKEGYKPPIHDFSIQSQDSDVTKSFLSEKGYRLMIVQYDIEKSASRFQPELNQLVRELMKGGKVKIWPVSGSSVALNEKYRKDFGVPYGFYSADVTVLKTIVRSNPGLVLFHDNVVVHDWPATALPSVNTVYSYMK